MKPPHSNAVSKAYDEIQELGTRLFHDCHLPNHWDLNIVNDEESVEIIRSNDGFVEMYVRPISAVRPWYVYEVFRVFPNDGPDDGRVLNSLIEAAHWFVHCQVQMKMNEKSHRFVNVIQADREKVMQSILTDLFDGDREYLGEVRSAVKTALT